MSRSVMLGCSRIPWCIASTKALAFLEGMPYPGTGSPGEGESSTTSPVLPSRSATTGADASLDRRNVLDRRERSRRLADAGAQVDLQVADMQAQQQGRPRPALVPPKGWLHFVAGGVGGMCGAIVTSPLDVVKTRLQSDLFAQKVASKTSGQKGAIGTAKKLAYHFVETGHILKTIATKEGPRALFKGLGPTLMGVIPARSINFYTYGNGKLIIAEQLNGGRESPAVHLLAASCAGIVTATATNPIWVVKTRMQLESHALDKAVQASRQAAVRPASSIPTLKAKSGQKAFSSSSKVSMASPAQTAAVGAKTSNPAAATNSAFSQYFKPARSPSRPATNSFQMTLRIMRTEGLAGLYKGLSASYLGVAEGTIQWTLYERLKLETIPGKRQFDEKDPPSQLRQWAGTVGAAGTAKMLASLITYPHEVLRTRLRQEPSKGMPRKYTGLLQTFRLVLREEGAAALYGGLSAHLLRVVPNAAIMFVVYESALSFGNKSTTS